MTLEEYIKEHFAPVLYEEARRILKMNNADRLEVTITFLEVYNIDCTTINANFTTPTLPIILKVQTQADDEGETWTHDFYLSGKMSGDFSNALANFSLYLNSISRRPYSTRRGERFARQSATVASTLIRKLDIEATAQHIRARFTDKPRFEPIAAIRALGLRVCRGDLADNVLGEYIPRGGQLPNGQIAKESLILMSRKGSGRFTLAHEFVHAYVHRYAFWLQALCGGEVETNIVEYQANKIATYLLMPTREFRREYEAARQKSGFLPEVVGGAINTVAHIFGVSICAARRRLIELGYDEVKGVYEYVDGKYVPAYAWEERAPKAGETYSLSQKQYENLVATEPRLKAAIDAGEYIYIENHVVKSAYVTEIGGVLHLKDEARGAIDKCAILFPLMRGERAKYTVVACGALRERVTTAEPRAILDNSKSLEEKATACLKRDKDILSLIATLATSFPIALRNTVKWTEMSQCDIAFEARISESTLSRYLSGTGRQPSKEVIIRLCYAMQLPYEVSLILLERAGHILQLTPQDSAYRMLLMHPQLMSLEDWNALFQKMEVEPLYN